MDSSSVVCDDGRVCPARTRCETITNAQGSQTTMLEVCAAPDQLTACDGLAQLAPCQLSDDPAGTLRGDCHDGVCILAACGNGILDSGEVCDDGNTVAGDHCSATCDSNETCPNGVVDLIDGELCDDGDAIPHDGCFACQPEKATWVEVTPGSPDSRVTALAFDGARRRVVLFGGFGNQPLGDTWEWNGSTWHSIPALISPQPRRDHAMTYDADTHHVVVFGGTDGTSQFNDLWEWDGVTWSLDDGGAPTPPPRSQAALAFDSADHHLYVFGGRSSGNDRGDFWQWDGTHWTELTNVTPHLPTPRSGAGMAYDPKRDVLVLFGGQSSNTDLADTWEYKNGDWTLIPPVNSPPQPRHAFAMAWSSELDEVMFAGGIAPGTTTSVLSETWAWDGTQWTRQADMVKPLGATALADDPGRQHVIAFGGTNGSTVIGDTLAFGFDEKLGGVTRRWSVVTPTPIPLQGASAAYDLARRRVVTFGGVVDKGTSPDTNELVDGVWQVPVLATQTLPPPRAFAALAYDEVAHEVVMFGGDTTTVPLGDTWTYAVGPLANEMAWTPQVGTSPPARGNSAMAYDAAHRATVLFGGTGTNGQDLADTWVWKDHAWTQLAISGPSARHSHALAYDRAHHQIVLFGGGVANAEVDNETWILDLDAPAWTQMTPAMSPTGRGLASLAWNPDRRRLTLFGGLATPSVKQDTWEWDGATWMPLVVQAPPGRFAASTFASADGGFTIAGGTAQPGSTIGRTDIWRLRYEGQHADDCEACGQFDCWDRCTPMCLPGDDCAQAVGPSCGDGVCETFEQGVCDADCPCIPTCGDFQCSCGETTATCPGDCP